MLHNSNYIRKFKKTIFRIFTLKKNIRLGNENMNDNVLFAAIGPPEGGGRGRWENFQEYEEENFSTCRNPREYWDRP